MKRRNVDDDDEIVRDGESVRTRMVLMDSVTPEFAFDADNHRPGYRMSSVPAVLDARAKAREARDAYIERTVNAWRRPTRDFVEPDQSTRRGAADPERADEVEAQLERWREPGGIDRLARDLEAKRRANHEEFAANLSNAWRTNKGTAAPATLGQEKGRAWRLSPPG